MTEETLKQADALDRKIVHLEYAIKMLPHQESFVRIDGHGKVESEVATEKVRAILFADLDRQLRIAKKTFARL